MADRRGKDYDWAPLDERGQAPTWERVNLAVLMDIRDESKRLNAAIWCPNFVDIPPPTRLGLSFGGLPMRRLFAALSLLALSGCATSMTTDGEPVTLTQIVAVDLEAAQQIALAHGDQLAAMCFPVLAKFIGTSTPSTDQIKGLISAWERARVLRMSVENRMGGVPVELQAACGGLLLSEREFIARLAIFGAGGLIK